YVLINTVGNSSGSSNLLNSSLIELIKPDLTVYVKNYNQGRAEKGEEFENFVLHEEEKPSLSIILSKYKTKKLEVTSVKNTTLGRKACMVENNFFLQEAKNLENKNYIRKFHILKNLFGSLGIRKPNLDLFSS